MISLVLVLRHSIKKRSIDKTALELGSKSCYQEIKAMTKSDKQAIDRSNVFINEITKVKFFPRDNEPNTASVRNTVGEGF